MRGVFVLALGLLSMTCAKREPAPSQPRSEAALHEHVDEPEHEPLPTRLKLSTEVIRDAKIRAAPITREVLPITLALPGEIVADPDRSARLASPIPGRIEDVRFQEGGVVKKGDVLAVVRVPDLGRLRSEQASATARAKAARANARRLEELLAQRLTSEQAYLDARAQADALELEAGAARDQVRALGLTGSQDSPSALTLRAPISGVVVSRNAVVGQPITAAEVLCEIVDLSEVWFLARVFEKDLGRLKPDAAAEVQLNAYPNERFPGRVEYIGRQVDPIARTVTARIRLSSREDLLRVGLFGTAHVSSDDAAGAQATLTVPRSALTELAGKQVVFVQHDDGDFELHEVVLGASAAGKVQVLSGLRDGEKVVVDGVFTLKSAVLKSTFAEEE